MPEGKNIKFDTLYLQNATSNVTSLYIIPEINNPDTISARLSIITDIQHMNNVKVLTGQLCMVTKNNQESNIDFEINDKGELIVHGNESKNYHINEDGDLIYTYR